MKLCTILIVTIISAGLAQEDVVEKPKTLKEFVQGELTTNEGALTAAKQTKSYQDAADAMARKESLTTALKHIDALTVTLTAAEGKQDFATCARIDNEMKSVPHTDQGLAQFYQIAVQEQGRREVKEAANKAVDKTGNTGLHVAVKTDDAASAKKLLSEGADPNKINDDGMTPMMMAARRGRLEVAKVLIDAGASKTLLDKGVRSALMWAAEESNLEVASLLIEQPNSVEGRVAWRTALMWAAEEGHADVAKMLVDAGSGK